MFAVNVQAVVDLILEKDKNLNQETGRYWEEILCRAYCFDRDAKEAAVVSTLTPQDLLGFYDRYFAPNGHGRRKIAAWVHGNQYPIDGSGKNRSSAGEGESGDGAVVSAEGGDVQARSGRVREVVIIEDYNEFKRSMPLLPLRTPPKFLDVNSASSKL